MRSLSAFSVKQLLFRNYDRCFLFISHTSASLNTLAISEYVREYEQKDSEIVVQTNSAINRIAEALTLYRNGALFHYRYARNYAFLHKYLPFVIDNLFRLSLVSRSRMGWHCPFVRMVRSFYSPQLSLPENINLQVILCSTCRAKVLRYIDRVMTHACDRPEKFSSVNQPQKACGKRKGK